MAYYRRYRKRTYRPKRRYYKRRGGRISAPKTWSGMTLGQVAGKAYSWAKFAKNVLNVEKKFVDVNYSQTPSSTTAVIENIFSNCSQGDTNNTHDGNSIRVKSLLTDLVFTLNSSATNTQVKWAIVLDTRSQGAAPAWTDVFSATSVTAFTNMEAQAARFQILRTGKVILGSSTTNLPVQIQKRIYMKLDNKVRYDDSNNVIENPIYFMTLSNEPTNTPTIACRQRFTYYDN